LKRERGFDERREKNNKLKKTFFYQCRGSKLEKWASTNRFENYYKIKDLFVTFL
jgi:hypothetical protein